MLSSYEYPSFSFTVAWFFLGLQLDAWDLLSSVPPALSWRFRRGPAFVPHAAAAHREGLRERERRIQQGLEAMWAGRAALCSVLIRKQERFKCVEQ